MKISAAILLLLAAAACSPSVPSEPTWVDDVRPILAANCIRCHSPPYIGGVPQYFRLDIYDDDQFIDPVYDEPVYGAKHMTDSFEDVLVTRSTMPPRFPLTDRQVDVLTTWRDVGAPQGEREDNAPPTLTVTAGPEATAGRVSLSYDIDDPDGDIVTGVIVADPGGGADPSPIVATNEIFVGRGDVRFSLPTAIYALTAVIDDGTESVEIELGEVNVP